MSKLEDVANVVLRVPGIVLLDLLYRWDVERYRAEMDRPAYSASFLHPYHVWLIYCLGHVVGVLLVVLPLRHLVNVYLYLLTALLLYVAHQTVRYYIWEELKAGHSGMVYEDQTSLMRSISTLTGLVIVSTLCSLLMRTRQAWLFSAPVLPLLARLAGFPINFLPHFFALSTAATILVMSYVGLSGIRPLCSLLSTAYREATQDMELYRLVALVMALWTQLAVPTLFLVFWVVLFLLQVYNTLSFKPGVLEPQGALFILLSSVSECCGTPYCLLGLTFTVSYLALGILSLCKFYLIGYAALQNGNALHRGVTEGVTLMLLSLQTGLLELQVLQRTFLLSIIFFIVVTSTLQSMIEIADPIVLALAATGNRSVWKHVRGLSLCLFLLVFPSFMAYKIAYFFHMDFWLLILVSSCLLTSLQVLGTLFIYSLFMAELLQDSRVERMDEIMYGVNAISRVLEFLVAVCVVAYGTWESIFGEWSWMGVSVIIVHSYFNVWLRAQSGWRSFLLRREAARKISHLPQATEEQLRAHSDVCSICFQEMSVAVITPCGHFFHADCLKKWLYVQDTCPLCHQLVRAMDRDHREGEYQDSDSEDGEAGGEGGVQREEETMCGAQAGGYGDNGERGTFVEDESTSPEIEEDHCAHEEDVSYRELQRVPLHEVEQILQEGLPKVCRKEQKKHIPCTRMIFTRGEHEQVAPYMEVEGVGDEVLSGRAVQALYREVEEVDDEVLIGKAVQVLYRKVEEVGDEVLTKKMQEKVLSCSAVQAPYMEVEEVGDEVLPRKKQEKVLSCSAVQAPYMEVEEVEDEVLPSKQQGEVLSGWAVQAPYMEVEEVGDEVLPSKDQEEVLSGRAVQAPYMEVEEVDDEVLIGKAVQAPYMKVEEGSEQAPKREAQQMELLSWRNMAEGKFAGH